MIEREKLVEDIARAIHEARSTIPWEVTSQQDVAYRDARAALSAMPDRQAERDAIVAWLRQQSDIGADLGNECAKGTTMRAAYGGGSLMLHKAADAIENGEHLKEAHHG